MNDDDYDYYRYTTLDRTPPDPQTKAELERWDNEFLADLIAVQYECGDKANASFNEANLIAAQRSRKVGYHLERAGAIRKAYAPAANAAPPPAPASVSSWDRVIAKMTKG